MKYEIHEFAKIYPALSKADLKALAEDIKANGLANPITLYQNKILDGVHRDKACEMVGVEPKYVFFYGSSDKLTDTEKDLEALYRSRSKNSFRRSLTSKQKAEIANKAFEIEKVLIEKEYQEKIFKDEEDRKKAEKVKKIKENRAKTRAATGAHTTVEAMNNLKDLKVSSEEGDPKATKLLEAIDNGKKTLRGAKEEQEETFKPKPPTLAEKNKLLREDIKILNTKIERRDYKITMYEGKYPDLKDWFYTSKDIDPDMRTKRKAGLIQ